MLINWTKQWEDHCPHFKNGLAHIDLTIYGGPSKTFLLTPGPGFGDLSHPTTRLMLCLMCPHVQGKTIIDIGCGSGILSIASILLGAKKAYAIDIDHPSLTHAQQNISLNHLDSHIKLSSTPSS